MSAPERRLAAVMYAEMRNFTRLSEVLQPDRVLALANEFFALTQAHYATLVRSEQTTPTEMLVAINQILADSGSSSRSRD